MSRIKPVLEGDRLALARLITQIENDSPIGRESLNELFPYTGNAHLIGVTGAPGTGKSSLVNHLARFLRQSERTRTFQLGIIAVDPSSPFSGGAILGDRVRMRELAGDPGVFIRSMASRGNLGGLATATSGVVQAMDAAGFKIILIETVGAGQAEVDIARLAHTTLVIEAPGLGDDIQAIKAGILEIADVLVVNKADRPGVEITERALRSMLQLAHPRSRTFMENSDHHLMNFLFKEKESPADAEDLETWIPPIIRTVAIEGEGVEELALAIERHFVYLEKSGGLKQRERVRLESELNLLLRETMVSRWREDVSPAQYEQALKQLVLRQISPWQAVDLLLDGAGI